MSSSSQLFIFTWRHHQIIHLKAKHNTMLMDLRRKLENLQDYASRIGDGVVSIEDLSNVDFSMSKRMSIFMQYSHQSAYAGAQQNFAVMQATNSNMFANIQPDLQKQYQGYVFKSLYEQERQKASDVEVKLLNKEETKINNEISDIETKLKMLDADEEKVCKAEDEGAKNTPEYC